ncbi:MAG TPA: hypothetical protein VK862_08125 [Afifellaceae bacterium]|nr:hypothetical protein [Afifellaceae bacterium]
MRRSLARFGLAAAILSSCLSGGPAVAATIGAPVDGIGSNTAVAAGNVGADGTIRFFVPLSSADSGTFGVGTGTSSDTCSGGGTDSCSGGTLDMYLRFDPVVSGSNLLRLEFDDLDLSGVNDPGSFLESIEIFDSLATSLALITSVPNPFVVSADPDKQIIEILVNAAAPTFWAKLTFVSGQIPYSSARNTEELLLATISPVPVPAALPLFAAGLAGIGAARLRRRSKAG